jgi:hypothetical protein
VPAFAIILDVNALRVRHHPLVDEPTDAVGHRREVVVEAGIADLAVADQRQKPLVQRSGVVEITEQRVEQRAHRPLV